MLALKGFNPSYLAENYGLTEPFIRIKFQKEYECVGINFDCKQTDYYEDEMMYGKNTHEYKYEELSSDEIRAYQKYKEKKRNYERIPLY